MLQRQSAPEKTPNWDSINTKVFEEERKGFWEGEGKLSEEEGSTPTFLLTLPNPTPSFSKTFVFIKSLLSVFPVGEEWGRNLFPADKKKPPKHLVFRRFSHFSVHCLIQSFFQPWPERTPAALPPHQSKSLGG